MEITTLGIICMFIGVQLFLRFRRNTKKTLVNPKTWEIVSTLFVSAIFFGGFFYMDTKSYGVSLSVFFHSLFPAVLCTFAYIVILLQIRIIIKK